MLSFLFKDDEVVFVLEDSLFTDLRILKILEYGLNDYNLANEIIEYMKKVPGPKSLEYRQEIFTDFLNNEKLESFYYKYKEIVSLYTLYKNGLSLLKKQIFLVIYLYNFYEFLIELRDFLKTSNIKSSCFKDLIEKINYFLENSSVEVVRSLYTKITSNFTFEINYKQNAPYYVIEKKEALSFEENIVQLASKLGIEFVKTPRLLGKKEINTFILNEIIPSEVKISLEEFYEKEKEVTDFTYLVDEIKFYITMKNFYTSLDVYCKTKLTSDGKDYFDKCYDLSLLIPKIDIVYNSYEIDEEKHLYFILGVNSGGKTTYLRSVALNYVFNSCIGYCFSNQATISYKRCIFTHFPNEENYALGDGRLHDEVKRIEKMEKEFNNDVIVFFNETFSSTSEEKACDLTKKLINEVIKTKTKILFVTHQYKVFEEISFDSILYFTPVVDVNNSNKKTYKIQKVQKELLTYVEDILIKHGLSKNQLENKLKDKKL